MIDRRTDAALIKNALRHYQVVALLGPRQSGKTTLAQRFLHGNSRNYFDLENIDDLTRINDASTALRPLKGLVVIDEIQRRPELFPFLRVLADRKPLPARFLILGSASPELLKQSSESLAGRIHTVHLDGLRATDVGPGNVDRLWIRGGFPRAYIPRNDHVSLEWRKDFVKTFLERDMPQLGITVPSVTLRRFWNMIAHYHAQYWNGAELARGLAVSEPTVRRYLDLLSSVFMIRQLPPWFENISKRQLKSPKIYVRDSGLLHTLLGITDRKSLELHPKVGASWEGFAIEEVLKALRPDDAYYWATQGGAELDLLIFKNGRRIGIECKRRDAPGMSPSMHVALQDLKLDELHVIYPGTKAYPLAEKVTVSPLFEFINGSLGRAGR